MFPAGDTGDGLFFLAKFFGLRDRRLFNPKIPFSFPRRKCLVIHHCTTGNSVYYVVWLIGNLIVLDYYRLRHRQLASIVFAPRIGSHIPYMTTFRVSPFITIRSLRDLSFFWGFELLHRSWFLIATSGRWMTSFNLEVLEPLFSPILDTDITPQIRSCFWLMWTKVWSYERGPWRTTIRCYEELTQDARLTWTTRLSCATRTNDQVLKSDFIIQIYFHPPISSISIQIQSPHKSLGPHHRAHPITIPLHPHGLFIILLALGQSVVFNMTLLNLTLFVVPSDGLKGLPIFRESFDGGVGLTHIVYVGGWLKDEELERKSVFLWWRELSCWLCLLEGALLMKSCSGEAVF